MHSVRLPVRGLAVIVAALALSMAGVVAHSTIHTGFGFASLDTAWDFSDSTACSLIVLDYCGDFSMGITRATAAAGTEGGGLLLVAMPPGAGIAVASADSTYEELTTAPEGPYYILVVLYPDEVYVIRTNEGHYAKIRGLDLTPGGDFTFEFSYQDDGTQLLVDRVSTEPTTWGRIKALYVTPDASAPF